MILGMRIQDGTPASTRVNPLYVDLAESTRQEASHSRRSSMCELSLDSKSNALCQDPSVLHKDSTSCESEASRAEAPNASSTVPTEVVAGGPTSTTGLSPPRPDQVASTQPHSSNATTPTESPAAPYHFGSADKLYKAQPESPRSQSVRSAPLITGFELPSERVLPCVSRFTW